MKSYNNYFIKENFLIIIFECQCFDIWMNRQTLYFLFSHQRMMLTSGCSRMPNFFST